MPTIFQNHYVLAVHKLRESARFFVDVLGFEIVSEPAGWVSVRKDQCIVNGEPQHYTQHYICGVL